MAYAHIIDSTPTNVDTGFIKHAYIVVNTGFTGTISVYDATSGTSPVVAVITNPTAGNSFNFYTLKTGFRVVASTTCDITAQTIPS